MKCVLHVGGGLKEMDECLWYMNSHNHVGMVQIQHMQISYWQKHIRPASPCILLVLSNWLIRSK